MAAAMPTHRPAARLKQRRYVTPQREMAAAGTARPISHIRVRQRIFHRPWRAAALKDLYYIALMQSSISTSNTVCSIKILPTTASVTRPITNRELLRGRQPSPPPWQGFRLGSVVDLYMISYDCRHSGLSSADSESLSRCYGTNCVGSRPGAPPRIIR